MSSESDSCTEVYDLDSDLESSSSSDTEINYFQEDEVDVANLPWHHGRFGIKLWMVCESETGYCLQFKPYKGKLGQIHKSLSYDVPMKLLTNSNLLNNFFTSIDLARDLAKNGTYLTGTVRANRKGFPAAIKTANYSSNNIIYLRNQEILAIGYKEKPSKPPVRFLSTYCEAISEAKPRRPNSEYPQVKNIYDKYMGRVDLNDMMMYVYMDERKGRKFHRKVVINILHRALLNSYIIYLQHCKDSPLLSRQKFNISVINSLVENIQEPCNPSTSQIQVQSLPQKREKRTTVKYQLVRHSFKHTGDQPFKCEYCDYKSAAKYQLDRHLFKHTRIKPFKCEFCDHKTSNKNDLNKHSRIHTGDKPFKCEYCDYRAAANYQLARHLIKHSVEKPFKCEYCDHTTSNRDDLDDHFHIHTSTTKGLKYKSKKASTKEKVSTMAVNVNKLEKFSGDKGSIRPESWLKLYELETSKLDEVDRINNLIYYLSKDALEWLADEILSNASIKKWDTVKLKLIQRFGYKVESPIVAASKRRLKKEETVEDYFRDKI
ncbi:hypothetical protein LAZ67_3005152 [Cordylochernes scorpioides]|uniref:C2H2-type domain-containing protein n=1 Tax=Cordylochernes scorpioides TaxID=51811 RepID=A0ABY6KA57_9ARAC|nr:hypothetical protein LAZ67_3005152 [Cordylochernes scorpioides]